MERIKFDFFTWRQNPEVLRIRASMEPMYRVAGDGTITYTGMGPLCRLISGSGVFQGEHAYKDFNALSVLMATGTAADLVHPIWGTIRAVLTKLDMEQESRENYVAYSFEFREADETGMIPPMNEDFQK